MDNHANIEHVLDLFCLWVFAITFLIVVQVYSVYLAHRLKYCCLFPSKRGKGTLSLGIKFTEKKRVYLHNYNKLREEYINWLNEIEILGIVFLSST